MKLIKSLVFVLFILTLFSCTKQDSNKDALRSKMTEICEKYGVKYEVLDNADNCLNITYKDLEAFEARIKEIGEKNNNTKRDQEGKRLLFFKFQEKIKNLPVEEKQKRFIEFVKKHDMKIRIPVSNGLKSSQENTSGKEVDIIETRIISPDSLEE